MVAKHWRTFAWAVGISAVVVALFLGITNQRDIAAQNRLTVRRTCQVAKDTRVVIGGILGVVRSNSKLNPNLNQSATSLFVARSREILSHNQICDLADRKGSRPK